MADVVSTGTRISYDDDGRGEPALLFMPGWCASRLAFNRLASLCSEKHHTLALDWRGHGRSGSPSEDFGAKALVEDALSVIEASGARQVVPVATAHAGWIAIELRRRLMDRIPKLVLVDWLLLDPPPPFLAALKALQDPEEWQGTRDQLFSMWTHGVTNSDVIDFVRRDMGSYGFDMWARAGREIATAYAEYGNPMQRLVSLQPHVPVLHLYAQPDDPGVFAAQRSLSATHAWFSVRKLAARSHFPTIEVPDEVFAQIEEFVASS